MTINDLLQSALEGIEREQRENRDPKLDALGRHIAVVLDDLKAAAASEASPSEPTYKQEGIVRNRGELASPS